MEVKRNPEQLVRLLTQNQNLEPERIQPLVFLIQAFGESYGYLFNVHHFRVFSRDLEADLCSLSTTQSSSTTTPSDLSSYVAKNVLSASLSEVELAAAHIYFEKKGYSASEIQQVLNPDIDLQKGAKALISTLSSFESKTLAITASGRPSQ